MSHGEEDAVADEIPGGIENQIVDVADPIIEGQLKQLDRQRESRTGGNRTAAADILGINRRTLQRKMTEAPEVFKEYL